MLRKAKQKARQQASRGKRMDQGQVRAGRQEEARRMHKSIVQNLTPHSSGQQNFDGERQDI